MGGKLVLAQDGQSFEHLIPADKGLDPKWVASLYQRGEPELYAGWDQQLKYVGMPVGGVGCGQLYLGGDGRLWLWDIFKCNYRREPDHGQRLESMTICGHYTDPVAFGEQYNKFNGADVDQGFVLRVLQGGTATTRTLDHDGFPGVKFRGEYPVGKVTYADAALPVTVELEAFSPFIPLDAQDSGLPATVMSFTVTNKSDSAVDAEIGGWLQNAVCPYTTDPALGSRRNRAFEADGRLTVLSTIEPPAVAADDAAEPREDIVFADFEGDDWAGWTANGAAFEGGPFPVADRGYQVSGGHGGDGSVNSHNQRVVEEVAAGDNLTGTLQSPAFTIERQFITLSIGGGNRPADCYIAVALASGEVLHKLTGHNNNALRRVSVDVSAHEGEAAHIRIIDNAEGAWGNIQADDIVFTDTPLSAGGIETRHGYGSMALSLLSTEDTVGHGVSAAVDPPAGLFGDQAHSSAQTRPLDEPLIGGVCATVALAPGESKTLDFAITWYFPDYLQVDDAPGFLSQLRGFSQLRRHYAPRFNSAGEVAGYLAAHREKLLGTTRLWNKTWYDSTLPYWLLDRTFISIDCAATQVLHWFDSGRLYGWEGVDCCPGTCTHVWHYAQGLARIFPELERAFREITDYGIAFHEDSGLIGYRAESADHEATDGQAGTILRVYREHQMSADDAFLRRLWPKIKRSVQFMLAKDPDGNGLIEGAQPHTLDAAWHGPMGWISGLYLASLAAGQAMAKAMGDAAFARECRQVIDRGQRSLFSELYDGEYFIHKPDPNVPGAIRSGTGCHIDQVLGQAWAHQVNLGRVMPKEQTVSALESLWRYNFAPDAGQYAIDHVAIEQTVRWYAMPGESGLVMCTWPKGGALDAIPGDRLRAAENPAVWSGPGGYFNECMNGFEYQAAAHMIYEGEAGSDLVERGLAITRAVHDRYAADKRNPYNEIECSDHYARSMAGYGVFLAACGFEYDGPAGHLGFAPRIDPDDFRAPFTVAEGWGTYHQQRADGTLTATIKVAYGSLRLNTVALDALDAANAPRATVNGQRARCQRRDDGHLVVELAEPVVVAAGEPLVVVVGG